MPLASALVAQWEAYFEVLTRYRDGDPEPIIAAFGRPVRQYRAVDVLVEAEVLRPLTDRKRNQVWGVGDMLDELDDLSVRIGAAPRSHV